MLERLPIKKDHLLIAAALLLLLAGYHFAIRPTIEAWQARNQLKAQLAQSSNLSYQPAYLERKNNNLNKLLNLYHADTTAFRSNIINNIATIAEKENVKLTQVPVQDASYNTDHFIIERLDFEGNYISLATTITQLQSTDGVGQIRSLGWRVTGIKSASDEHKKLTLEVYMEICR